MARQQDVGGRNIGLLVAAMLGVGASAAPTYSIGLFLGPIARECGWTRAEISIAITITAGITMLASPFVGRLIDAVGARPLALCGLCCSAGGMAAIGLVHDYRWYLAGWAGIGVAMAFSSPLVWTVPVAAAFSRNRGLALAIAFSGTSMMGIVAPLASAWLIYRAGWRLAWAGLGGLVLAAALPMALLCFRDRAGPALPAERAAVAPGKTLREALATREFWVLAASFLLAGACVMAVVMHFVPALGDGGVARFRAAAALSVLSVSALVGRMGSGWVFDRMFVPRVGAVILVFPALGCLGLASNMLGGPLPFVYAVLLGFAVGAEVNLASLLTARYFGFRAFGAIYGALFATFSIGYTLGPVAAGWLYDRSGGYRIPLRVLAGGFLLSAALLLACRAYPRFAAAPIAHS